LLTLVPREKKNTGKIFINKGMAALQSKDFSKTASSGDYAGETRDKIFSLKIKDKKPFIIGTTKAGKTVVGIGYDSKKRILQYKESSSSKVIKETSFTKVFKDKDFGGGSGSGGGAEDTKYTESLQCYYCSYVFNVKKGKCTSVSPKDLKSAEKYVNADVSLNDCLKNGPANWVETDVYIKTANTLYDKHGSKMRGVVYFHRGSKFMNEVYKAKADCHKIDKQNGMPQAPGSFSNDKWNPGDIWASTFRPTESPLKEYTSSWGELNSAVYDLAKKGKLLGISLKKVSANQAKAKWTEFNTPSQLASRPSYKFLSFTYGKTGDFFNSQDIYVKTSEGDVQFRTFGGDTSWQGEIKGGAAAGGKIGGGNVNFYCQQVFGKTIYGGFGSERDYLNWIKQNETNGKFQEQLYELYKKYNSKSQPSKPLMEKPEFMGFMEESDYNFKNSKAICMQFVDILMSSTAAKRNEFTTKMFRYAQSDTDQSSYFVKLY
jgi:hypothetical protein